MDRLLLIRLASSAQNIPYSKSFILTAAVIISYPFLDSIGERIKYLRKQEGFYQKILAEMIDITQQALSNMESNKTRPSHETLEKLFSKTGYYPEWILYGRGPQKEGDQDMRETTEAGYEEQLLIVLSRGSDEVSDEFRKVAAKELKRIMERNRDD